MTTLENFDIATDLKVEFYLPGFRKSDFIIGVSKLGGVNLLSADGFVIGVSLIGGGDVLTESTSAFNWNDLACLTAQVQTSTGGQVIDQLYYQPQPGQASFTLQSKEVDPNYSSSFRPGVPVRVRLAKDEVDEILWVGIVESISASYDKDGNNLLQVSAYDLINQVMNARIATFNSAALGSYVTPLEQLELVAEALGLEVSLDSIAPLGKIPSQNSTNVIPSKLIYDAIQVGLGIFWIDPATQELVLIPRPSTLNPPEGTPVIGNNHGGENHLCMTDLKANSTEQTVFNSLLVTLESDSSVSVLRENEDSIDLYGVYAANQSLNTTDLTELNSWADRAFNQYATSVIDSVETLTLDRNNNITEAALFKPGQIVGVNFTQGIIDVDEYFTATKVSHFIDVNTWLTTLEVWKEA